MTYDVDVLIAGAGPVGLMAATCLARAGVSVRLVDAASGPAMTSRALGAHARSMEIYDQLGVLGDIAAHGTRVNAFIRHRGAETVRMDFEFGDLKTQFPYMFNIDQVIVERVLRASAAVEGVAVEWDAALESFEQDAEGVTAVVRHGGASASDSSTGHDTGSERQGSGVESIRARYLWGCDGGHSMVRKSLGLPLTGESAHTWLIADAVVHTDIDTDGVHWLFPAGNTMMLFPFPEPGKWRLLDTSGDGDPEDLEQIAAQLTGRLTTALQRDTVVENPTWVSKFTIQQRAVPAMHIGRCFVAGDAAHVHSPASGQGLNTGIQDAYNLAWKLAMVIHGHAGPALLNTYDAERVPIGKALLASTAKVMANTMDDTATHETPDTDLRFMRQLITSMSGLAIGYPESPLTLSSASATDKSTSGGPRPGERLTQVSAADAQAPGWMSLRALLRRPTWKLLEFRAEGNGAGEPDAAIRQPASVPAWLDVVTISRERGDAGDLRVWDPDARVRDTLGASDGDWMLVRPDGYLSARGAGEAELRASVDRLTALLAGAPAPGTADAHFDGEALSA